MCFCNLSLSFLSSHIDNKSWSRIGIFFHRKLLRNRLCLWSNCDEITRIGMVITAIYLHAPLDHTLNITSDIKTHRIDTALCHRKSIVINLAAMLKRSTLCNVTNEFAIFCGHCKVTIIYVTRKAICTIIKCHTDRICAFHRRETVILHNFLFRRCPVAIILDG